MSLVKHDATVVNVSKVKEAEEEVALSATATSPLEGAGGSFQEEEDEEGPSS
jgi:hypothetical protein